MWRCTVIVAVIVQISRVESSCPVTTKYFVDCSVPRTLNESVRFCAQHGMALANLTNSSILNTDIAVLNGTLNTIQCSVNFWFGSGNVTGYVGNTGILGNVLTLITDGLLSGVGGLVTQVLCILPICLPTTTTTAAPILQAMTVCTRLAQRPVVQKCSAQPMVQGISTFQFVQQMMYVGVLDTFDARSRTGCSALCSSNATCVGVGFENETCTFYM